MKTIKAMLKDFLYSRGMKEKQKPSETSFRCQDDGRAKPSGENEKNHRKTDIDDNDKENKMEVSKEVPCEEQSKYSPKNLKENETESDESARIPELGDPHAGKNPRTDKEQPEGGYGENVRIATGGKLKPGEDTPSLKGMEDALAEAYEKGRIAGRNERIEEIYFPKVNDGVPHFRSGMKRPIAGGDIFSIAKEA